MSVYYFYHSNQSLVQESWWAHHVQTRVSIIAPAGEPCGHYFSTWDIPKVIQTFLVWNNGRSGMYDFSDANQVLQATGLDSLKTRGRAMDTTKPHWSLRVQYPPLICYLLLE